MTNFVPRRPEKMDKYAILQRLKVNLVVMTLK